MSSSIATNSQRINYKDLDVTKKDPAKMCKIQKNKKRQRLVPRCLHFLHHQNPLVLDTRHVSYLSMTLLQSKLQALTTY